MYSQWEKQTRENQAERDQRKTGSYEYQNVTDAQYQLANQIDAFRSASHGLPLIIQDAQGNLSAQIGLTYPVNR